MVVIVITSPQYICRTLMFQQFTCAHIGSVASLLDDDISVHQTFLVLDSLAENRPRDVAPHGDDVIKAMRRLESQGLGGANLLVRLSSVSEVAIYQYTTNTVYPYNTFFIN